MELRHLRYFIAVADQLNFSRAAELLQTAQPSLSQQIRQLEREVGVALFTRTNRRIALTPAGAELLAEARAIIARVDVAVAHAREAERGLRGELRLGYTVSAMMTTLPAAIRKFRAGHRDVRIVLKAMGPTEIVTALRERAADVGGLLATSEVRSSASVDVRRLGVVPLAAMLPTGHPLADRPTLAIEAIGTAPLILYSRQMAGFYDVVHALCAKREFTPARVEEVDRMETILGLVAAGEGVSVVPSVYRTLCFPGVTYVALDPEPAAFQIIVARSLAANAALTAAFADTCERVTHVKG